MGAAVAPAGKLALRSPLRTRSVAGGSAAFPADKARRRSMAAARPPDASVDVVAEDTAMECSGNRFSGIRRGTR
jgi:hypothetical protein